MRDYAFEVLGDGDLDAGAVDLHGEDLASGGGDGGFDALAGFRLDEENDAAAASCAADFAG